MTHRAARDGVVEPGQKATATKAGVPGQPAEHLWLRRDDEREGRGVEMLGLPADAINRVGVTAVRLEEQVEAVGFAIVVAAGDDLKDAPLRGEHPHSLAVLPHEIGQFLRGDVIDEVPGRHRDRERIREQFVDGGVDVAVDRDVVDGLAAWRFLSRSSRFSTTSRLARALAISGAMSAERCCSTALSGASTARATAVLRLPESSAVKL